jgi:prolyl oligopeptidase
VELDAGTETNINLNLEIYYHVVGSDQSEDILCWKDPEHPKYSFGASVTEDGKVTTLPLLPICVPVISICLFTSFIFWMRLQT